jgi:hypothetical protein
MEMAIMRKESVALRVILVVFLAELLSFALPAPPCRGSDRAPADPTISLDVQNEPLRNVLGEISKITGWKIKVPEKLMDKPITQTLNQVSIEEGLRFILKAVGVENLLLTYDETGKTITVYDTEIPQGHSANRPPVQGDAPPPVFSTSDRSDPLLQRPAKETGSEPSRGTTRSRSRKQTDREEE